ncbi:uncharacterized protein LOC105230211 [Bactrocera dorsalis]|uniref:Uncharacterized protein LOC105230211 n=1 Tax=Bactrocera dorsalis TaxID=27457 RepID=A0ABM3JE28_BACDO|nr:uncharacterized protein LOC105230211 [Bactrocera dorsalis]
MLCFKTGVICLLFVACVLAEAPYAATGWRPLRPFNLPTDYLPPTRDIEKQRQPQQPIFDVELKKQRIEYVGQIQENILSAPNRRPANAYLPPRRQSTDLDLKVQRPPYQKPGPRFVLQTAGYRPQGQQNTRIFQISNTKQQPTGEQRPLRPQKPKNFAFGVQQQTALSRPAQTYGPPSNGEEQVFTINYPEDIEPRQADPELEEATRIAIEALNAAKDAYNRQLESEAASSDDGASEADVQEVNVDGTKKTSAGYPAVRATRGQYYVLGADNRLQLVRFTTTQSEEEARRNGGFTAQLQYTPVGEINDPIFKSNSNGQLVRIVKK